MCSRPRSLSVRPRQDTPCIDDDEVIDLCTPILHVDRTWLATRAMNRFPRLRERIAILPLFPCMDNLLEHCCPLLANVARTYGHDHPLRAAIDSVADRLAHQLTSEELELRQPDQFQPACQLVDRDRSIPSFLRDTWQFFYGDLVDRLKVDMALLDYNYTRLITFTRLLANEQAHVFDLPLDLISSMNEREHPLALEFFLQFDVNMFYMKTCSFRFARPRTILEGLFCLQEPEARYELSACGNCALCYPQYNREHHRKKTVVDFSRAHAHTFVNGYQTILNCSAVSVPSPASVSLSRSSSSSLL
jgi:hypothetical protein